MRTHLALVSLAASFLLACSALGEPAAKVNGQPISLEEYARFTVHWNGYSILQRLINNKLIEQEAERRGITVSEDEIQRELYRQRQQHPSEETYKEFLRSSRLTEEDLRYSARINCLSQKVVGEEISVSEEAARSFYEENKLQLFKTGQRWKLKEICVETEEEAEEILAQIKAGKPFEEMAKAHSFSPSAENGGDVGWIEEGERGVLLERHFRRLRPNQVSKPVPSAEGFYLFLVSEKQQSAVKSFEEVKEEAMQAVERAARIDAYGKLVEKLRSDARIEVLLWPDTQ